MQLHSMLKFAALLICVIVTFAVIGAGIGSLFGYALFGISVGILALPVCVMIAFAVFGHVIVNLGKELVDLF